jgi:hydroxyacylglutathione hydrolase
MNRVIIIPAFGDNYIYLYRDIRRDAFVVDPGQSRAVFEALKKQQLNLKAALITHNHFDHTGGVAELKKETGCEVFEPGDSDEIEICGAHINVIQTPGHTRDSVCYYVRPNDNHDGMVFTGDTMFIGGCGRLMGTDANTMWNSLQKIIALPDGTVVYPGHDYTLENYQFATQTAPNIEIFKKRLQEIKDSQQQGISTVPSTIALEKAANIFLLAGDPQIKQALGMSDAQNSQVFAWLRKQKDLFG